jgi:hypothetical protein
MFDDKAYISRAVILFYFPKIKFEIESNGDMVVIISLTPYYWRVTNNQIQHRYNQNQ